jgi:hypothetical protein
MDPPSSCAPELGRPYCTITVSAAWWLKLPELAVTVTVYVPAGVPFVADVDVDVDDPPPQPAITRNAITIVAAHTTRLRLLTNSRHEAPKTRIQPTNRPLAGQSPNGSLSALLAAVVVTVTITGVGELPTLTDPGTLQIGAGLAVGA